MKVKRIDINWQADLSIYASESFLKAVGDEYGWLGGFDDDAKLRCILPYTIVKKAHFRLVRFRVETIPLCKEFDVIEEKIFLNKVIEYFQGTKADMIIPATTNTIFRTYPDGAVAAPYGTYLIDLSQSEDAIWANMSSSHRRQVRQAVKKKVIIRNGIEFVDPAYTLVRDTFRKSAIPFMSHDKFKHMLLSLGSNVKIYVAEYSGSIQGCIVIPFSRHSAYYVYGGSIPTPERGVNHLLHWQAMQEFRALGVSRYDFVGVRIDPEKGSKQEGLKIYKERFGGKLVEGYMWKYPLRIFGSFVYSIAARLLRGGDIIDYECHKLEQAKAGLAI